ncbi:MAG: TIGR03768 family metallophosphoesterase [Ignavibacteriae bacterium]|nr:TIGR03768 family metallophosphoesterase [Ignavibacteriota bacterium]
MKKANSILICTLILIGFILVNDGISQQASYPIDTKVVTTQQRMVVPVPVPTTAATIFPYEVSKYSENGYGVWQYGPGLEYVKRLDLMSPSYSDKSVANKAKLLNFFTITDIHLTDKESPTQVILYGFKGGIISAYSAIMLYTTHVLDAAIQTVNALNKQNPIDFGISLGDNCNNTQYNELRWFIDVLDGKEINPDSGIKDDPIPGPLNDYQDVYKAAGLDKSIPWYQAIGNHDHFWMGIKHPDDYLNTTYTGENVLNMGDVLKDPLGIKSRGFYMGVLDGTTKYGDVINIGPVSTTKVEKIPADQNRRSLKKEEWFGEFFNTSSNPVGHGFNEADAKRGFGCYSFEPKSDLPLKVIVIDDTQRDEDPDTDIYGHAEFDKERYDWLIKELDKGQAEGKLMIIAAHIPIGINDPSPELGMSEYSVVTEKDFLDKMHTYPNLILWVAGHRHLNTVTALKSPDPTKPELGFWEVETSSLREFPQQLRTFEIIRNSDNTISIMATNVDPAVKEGSFAAISRSYGIAAFQIFKNPPVYSYNAELVKQLTPEMQKKIQNCGTPIKK